MADSTARSRDWFQIVSNVAIIIGLGLVIYELNQSKQLAHVQFMNDDFARIIATQVAIMGEDPRGALAKAALHPADLEETDAMTLDAFYRIETMNWTNMKLSSGMAGIDRSWQVSVAEQAREVFTSEPGRRWLRTWAVGLGEDPWGRNEIAEVALRAVDADSTSHYGLTYRLLLAKQ